MHPDRWRALEEALARNLHGPRLAHSYRVLATARPMGRRFGAPADQVDEAALLHDYAKEQADATLLGEARRLDLLTDPAEAVQPQLLHGAVAAGLLAEQGLVTDTRVLAAIRWHTTGRAGMGLLEKLIWVADFVEPGRHFPGVDRVRDLAEHDLDGALLAGVDLTIQFVLQQRWQLHLATVRARNWLLAHVNSRT